MSDIISEIYKNNITQCFKCAEFTKKYSGYLDTDKNKELYEAESLKDC